MSGPSYNAPAQPTYGEGMADAMKAQMEQLLGQGDFADIYADAGFAGGNLGDIIREVEAPIRQQTAQTDTDVLRQTLLGNQREIQVQQDPDTGKFGIAGAEVVRGEDGEAQTAGGGRYQMVQISEGRKPVPKGEDARNGVKPTFAIIDTETGGITKKIGGQVYNNIDSGGEEYLATGTGLAWWRPKLDENMQRIAPPSLEDIIQDTSVQLNTLQQTIDTGGEEAVAQEFTRLIKPCLAVTGLLGN